MAIFVMQLLRGTGQAQRLESTLGSCAGVLLSCLGAGWIATSALTASARCSWSPRSALRSPCWRA